MPSPRYVPRNFATHPAEFGQEWKIEWVQPAAGNEAAAVGARLQHGIAWYTRKAIRRSRDHQSLRSFADANGINYTRLTAMLRGEIVMRLDDAAHLCELLDLPVGLRPRASAVEA